MELVLAKMVRVDQVGEMMLKSGGGCVACAGDTETWWCMWCLCMCSLNLVVDIVLAQVVLNLVVDIVLVQVEL